MDENQTIDHDRIIKINIEEEMKSSYIDYSMSVIVARALPDVRDGFKPVHRRILYGMLGIGNTATSPTRSVRVLLVRCWVSTTLMATDQSMVPSSEWVRNGICAISSLMVRVTLVA